MAAPFSARKACTARVRLRLRLRLRLWLRRRLRVGVRVRVRGRGRVRLRLRLRATCTASGRDACGWYDLPVTWYLSALRRETRRCEVTAAATRPRPMAEVRFAMLVSRMAATMHLPERSSRSRAPLVRVRVRVRVKLP